MRTTMSGKASGRLILTVVEVGCALVFSALLGPGAHGEPPASAKASRHWAFQPIRRVEVPGVSGPASARTPIDRFLLSSLEARGLSFSPEAQRATLIRRASLDLWGLPPA